jgi:hypothetical protein
MHRREYASPVSGIFLVFENPADTAATTVTPDERQKPEPIQKMQDPVNNKEHRC